VSKKRLRCILCHGTDRVIPHEEDGFGLCEHCEKTCDWWGGFPVLPDKPEKCPICGNKHIDTGLMSDEEFDEKLAAQFGVDWDSDDDEMRTYTYTHEEMECVSESHDSWGGIRIGYGKRHYWNQATGNFDAPKPLTPTELIRAENAQQEAAGQMRLPLEGQS
jgi:hypothetical protein